MIAGQSCIAGPSVLVTSFDAQQSCGCHLPFSRMDNKKSACSLFLQEENV
jgi:hypothetical protein